MYVYIYLYIYIYHEEAFINKFEMTWRLFSIVIGSFGTILCPWTDEVGFLMNYLSMKYMCNI